MIMDVHALLQATINKIRTIIDDVEDNLDVLLARGEHGARITLEQYDKKRKGGMQTMGKTTSKVAPKKKAAAKPKEKIGKNVKRK